MLFLVNTIIIILTVNNFLPLINKDISLDLWSKYHLHMPFYFRKFSINSTSVASLWNLVIFSDRVEMTYYIRNNKKPLKFSWPRAMSLSFNEKVCFERFTMNLHKNDTKMITIKDWNFDIVDRLTSDSNRPKCFLLLFLHYRLCIHSKSNPSF